MEEFKGSGIFSEEPALMKTASQPYLLSDFSWRKFPGIMISGPWLPPVMNWGGLPSHLFKYCCCMTGLGEAETLVCSPFENFEALK
jgi:hypothetical protein